jgi:hypothetical protein
MVAASFDLSLGDLARGTFKHVKLYIAPMLVSSLSIRSPYCEPSLKRDIVFLNASSHRKEIADQIV